MSSKLTRADVLRVAELARLELSESEVETFTQQLADILEYAEQVQQVDTTGVPPTAHALTEKTAWRDDIPAPSLDHRDVLSNAPQPAHDAGLFKVPKVL